MERTKVHKREEEELVPINPKIDTEENKNIPRAYKRPETVKERLVVLPEKRTSPTLVNLILVIKRTN